MSIHRARLMTADDRQLVGRWARVVTAIHFAVIAIIIVVAASVGQAKSPEAPPAPAPSYHETGAPPVISTVA